MKLFRVKKLTKAMRLIKKTCLNNFDCDTCPLSDNEGINCMLMKTIPCEWFLECERKQSKIFHSPINYRGGDMIRSGVEILGVTGSLKGQKPENKAQANGAGENEVRELDDCDLEQVSGAGNPFDRPRMGFQPIDDNLRKNG